jgi:hypothetical protein
VPDVDGHELAVEVDEALAFRRVEVNALGAGDGNGIDLRLRGPFVERVLAQRSTISLPDIVGLVRVVVMESFSVHSPQSRRDLENWVIL